MLAFECFCIFERFGWAQLGLACFVLSCLGDNYVFFSLNDSLNAHIISQNLAPSVTEIDFQENIIAIGASLSLQ